MSNQNVLFLCTGNSARSQMAEAFLRELGGDKFKAHSAGLDPQGVHPMTVQVLEEKGINIENQRSKGVEEYMGKVNFAFFITVCGHAEQNCPRTFLMSAGKHLHWDFDDPAAATGSTDEKLSKFRQIRDQIESKVKSWLKG
ncbi:MAG: arsenate reductase ArsC [Desulfonatronovibrio sp.]